MSETLSAIERYRAAWKPNKANIAKLKRAIARAQNSGKYIKALALTELLLAEMRPPRHLPLKGLIET